MPIVEASSYGKPSTAPTQDGQGRPAPNPDMKAGSRYIYYRLYTKDGPLDSNNPIYSNDRFISRIPSRLVRPPQTAASLKKYLCKTEGLIAVEKSILYHSLSEKMVLEDSTRLLFRGTSGPGVSELDPMALVVDISSAEKRSQAASTVGPANLPGRGYEQRYVHYVLYDEDGGVVSKASFDEDNPFLGRIDTLSIPPPRTVAFLKYRISKSEDISGHNIQIFEDEASDSTLNDSDDIAFLADTFPGFIEDQPLAITYECQKLGTNDVTNEDPNEIIGRDPYKALSILPQMREELEKMKKTHVQELDRLKEEAKKSNEVYSRLLGGEKLSPSLIQALLEMPSFTKKLKAKTTATAWGDPTWHNIRTGDTFYTDGISRTGKCNNNIGIHEYDCYLAISSSGKQACMYLLIHRIVTLFFGPQLLRKLHFPVVYKDYVTLC